MRILIVEDDHLLAAALERVLPAEGYTVEVAPNGIDGLHPATVDDYDAVIVAIRLHMCRLGGRLIDLAAREFALIRFLMTRPSVVAAKGDVLDHIWGDHHTADPNLVEVYMSALRRKIEAPDTGLLLDTVRGAGYRLHDTA